ncbi:hypothetical protein KIN20_002886 [Parelaphostrongylus tenuis]|uniref:Uncharacterized protein n=1 Tax=Parelaphostrongylus tenuis TaxID=148309 RepID=A0AAD5QDU0_PARTN|nr:hypothetical protein KIN20_002886 [Parelaphostrongylus tenuis]
MTISWQLLDFSRAPGGKVSSSKSSSDTTYLQCKYSRVDIKAFRSQPRSRNAQPNIARINLLHYD